MLKRYSNILFESTKEKLVDLNLVSFERIKQRRYNFFKVKIKYSPLHFIIINTNNNFNKFNCKYVKFEPKYRESQYIFKRETNGTIELLMDLFLNYFVDFENIIIEYERWLYNHVNNWIYERNCPDYWETFLNSFNNNFLYQQVLYKANFFNNSEKKKIIYIINKISIEILKKYNISSKQKDRVIKLLDYLAKSLNRLNKIDWKALLISTIINIALEISTKGNLFQEIYNIFNKSFESILNLLR
jgi:hypothetical protein